MNSSKLPDKPKLFLFHSLMNGQVPARTYQDRVKIAKRLNCSYRTVRKILLNLKRQSVLRMGETKTYFEDYETGYASQMPEQIIKHHLYRGLWMLIKALEPDHPLMSHILEYANGRTTADSPSYAFRCE
jgi:hypothetical protein